MEPFALGSLLAVLLVAGVGALVRGLPFAIFTAVMLGAHSAAAVALRDRFEAVAPIFVALHVLVFVHFASLVRARARPIAWHRLVARPALFFLAGTLLAVPWAALDALGFEPWAPALPYVVGLVGLVESLVGRESEPVLVLGDPPAERLERRRLGASSPSADRPLRVVQITDPHLGPFMSVSRLRRIVARAVEREPDLVLLTGDFLTMESQRDPRLLADALAPLSALPGRAFACFGNHDLEAPATVERALALAGVELLRDEARCVDTPAGRVQILGADFSWRDRAARLEALCRAHPREPGALRLLLLHDPGAFVHVPDGEADLVLSGHTHGGQLGLLTLGLPWTLLSAVSDMPDHGAWALGRNRLYVHRGTGHYGFPLRIGVPSEESVLSVYRASSPGDAAAG